MNEVTIRIPATSANLGSGFDSLGIALKLYNYISVKKRESGLLITVPDEPNSHIPRDNTNLVYRAINTVAKRSGNKTGGLYIELKNNIPSSRGLGSSSAAIVGGLMAGNALFDHPFSKEELLNLAAELEGHADNVAPAMYGGFTTSVMKGQTVKCIKNSLLARCQEAVFRIFSRF